MIFIATEIKFLKKDARPIALFHGLQNVVALDVCNPRMIYEGKKLAYCKAELFSAINVSAFLSGRLQTP